MTLDAAEAKVFTIPPGDSFLDTLAAGLLARFPDPEALTKAKIFLPTRRAGRGLREAFLRQTGGKPLLLPVMQPVGDLWSFCR